MLDVPGDQGRTPIEVKLLENTGAATLRFQRAEFDGKPRFPGS
jgi:hypothetical protein